MESIQRDGVPASLCIRGLFGFPLSRTECNRLLPTPREIGKTNSTHRTVSIRDMGKRSYIDSNVF